MHHHQWLLKNTKRQQFHLPEMMRLMIDLHASLTRKIHKPTVEAPAVAVARDASWRKRWQADQSTRETQDHDFDAIKQPRRNGTGKADSAFT